MEKLKQDLQNYQINSKTYVKYDTDGLNQYKITYTKEHYMV